MADDTDQPQQDPADAFGDLAQPDPASAFGDLVNNPIQNVRSDQFNQLYDNPDLVKDLFSLTKNEVGGQGPEAQQAFLETVFNRAASRGQSLDDVVHDRNYYPQVSFRDARLSDDDINSYGDLLKQVAAGSNISNYATGNASGNVGFNGGQHTVTYGGERFGVEGPDIQNVVAFASGEASQLPSQAGPASAFGDLVNPPQPSPQPLPAPSPQPSVAQQNNNALSDFLSGALPSVAEMIPKSIGQAVGMALYTPVQDAPGAIGQAYSAITHLIQTGQIPPPDPNNVLVNLEAVKNQYGGGSPQYRQAAGKVAATILPQMAMAAVAAKGVNPNPAPLNPTLNPSAEGILGSKFRATYAIDKDLGNSLEALGASRESALDRSTTHLNNMLQDLNPQQQSDVGRLLVSERLKSLGKSSAQSATTDEYLSSLNDYLRDNHGMGASKSYSAPNRIDITDSSGNPVGRLSARVENGNLNLGHLEALPDASGATARGLGLSDKLFSHAAQFQSETGVNVVPSAFTSPITRAAFEKHFPAGGGSSDVIGNIPGASGQARGGGTSGHQQVLSDSEAIRIASDPKIQQALKYYEQNIKPEIEKYRLNSGLSQRAAAGKSSRFISLIPKEQPIPKQYSAGQQVSRASKRTRFAQQAEGTAPEYHTDIRKIVQESYAEALRKSRRNDFFNLAHQKGLAEYVTEHGANGPYKTLNDRSLALVDDKPTLLNDLRAADERSVQTGSPIGGALGKIQRGATAIALSANPAEIMNHMRRQLNLLASVPPVGRGLAARMEALLPYIGPKAGAFIRAVTDDMSSAENVAIRRDIIDSGGGSTRAFSQQFKTNVPGLKQIQAFTHRLLFSMPEGRGIGGWDMRMRVQLEKIRRAAEGNVDPQRIRQFANQIGQYGANSDWFIEGMKKVNPYAATTLPMRLTEMQRAIGMSGLKSKSATQAMFRNLETQLRGTGGTILGLAAANYALSGKWPWENDAGHQFDLNTGTKDRNGNTVYMKLRVIAPELARPVNTAALPNLLHEKTANDPQYLAALATGFANQGLEIIGGPAQNTALTAATGIVPYMSKTPGKKFPELMSLADQRHPFEGSVGLENIMRAVSGLNPLAGALYPARYHTEAPGALNYIEKPLLGTNLVKPFGDMYTSAPTPKVTKPLTVAQMAAANRRAAKYEAAHPHEPSPLENLIGVIGKALK